ncbi:hypothetical protein [Sphingobium yanoikuyae]|uniref:Uncharacterized protein n=1 Tax=Sphingobium yanoikuyae ATCC 51230 TaxID=883163 RepID=K9CY93_SPHYA|nr:hypothetical protein [Sphingobium yanoikuyae]EKU75851.1 hypothetical protein HMPREF9718_01203 [Sphingobium yanoikuyae ATCC 51230]WQE05636.1 hypothetical protein U0025_15090 [Sphingobium yanoikuyae]
MSVPQKRFVLDERSQALDLNMVNFFFYPMSSAKAHDSPAGQIIHDFLTSRLGVALLIGAVLAAPSRPPIVAAEPFLAMLAGDRAFTDEMKKYTGRVVGQIIGHLGGVFVRRGVKITVPSRYGSGSIYSFQGQLLVDQSMDAVKELEDAARLLAKVDPDRRSFE